MHSDATLCQNMKANGDETYVLTKFSWFHDGGDNPPYKNYYLRMKRCNKISKQSKTSGKFAWGHDGSGIRLKMLI